MDEVGGDSGPVGPGAVAAPKFPVVVTLPTVLGGAAWAVSVVYFVAQAVAQGASARPYDMATRVISDLGNAACGPVVCSPLHGLMNATFVVVGGCHWLGAVATSRAWPARPTSTVGRALLALAGAGLVIVGANPENVHPAGHVVGAVLGLVGLNLAMIVLGASVLRAMRWLGSAAVAAGFLGFVGLILFLSGTGPRGATERLADYPGTVIVVVFGVTLLAGAVRAWSRAHG